MSNCENNFSLKNCFYFRKDMFLNITTHLMFFKNTASQILTCVKAKTYCEAQFRCLWRESCHPVSPSPPPPHDDPHPSLPRWQECGPPTFPVLGLSCPAVYVRSPALWQKCVYDTYVLQWQYGKCNLTKLKSVFDFYCTHWFCPSNSERT
jgi:hypothetical protein